MRKSITQESEYGCGVACYAFVLKLSYAEAATRLGRDQANSNRFWVKDFRNALNHAGLEYTSKHIRPRVQKLIYAEGTIVLIRRSSRYPTGHYLIRHNESWMDPWINLPYCKDVNRAKSGFRKRLPGKPMYTLSPVSSWDTPTVNMAY